jgi:phosphatidylserine decarboxylase
MFHKEGFKIIINTFLLCTAIALASEYLIKNFWIQKSLQVASVVIMVLVLQFFRNPKRVTVLNDHHIISPVDGKVVVIEEVFEKEFFKDKRLQVSIFMSPINVHVTRNAISGSVVCGRKQNSRANLIPSNCWSRCPTHR